MSKPCSAAGAETGDAERGLAGLLIGVICLSHASTSSPRRRELDSICWSVAVMMGVSGFSVRGSGGPGRPIALVRY
ncbi:hypothetical protein BGM19_02005 [Streptomyces agglomeratus]|nr:hypothetical protein BGM19_02005 [Streptomyces agglomeratus]